MAGTVGTTGGMVAGTSTSVVRTLGCYWIPAHAAVCCGFLCLLNCQNPNLVTNTSHRVGTHKHGTPATHCYQPTSMPAVCWPREIHYVAACRTVPHRVLSWRVVACEGADMRAWRPDLSCVV